MTADQGRLVLAGTAGEYRELTPAASLDRHFTCLWTNTLAADQSGRVAVVPDGCVDITWIDGALVVAGPDVTTSVSPIAPGTTVLGVRFRPGAASLWLGLPLSEIVGSRVDLANFWGGQAREIAQKIGDGRSTAERVRALEAALCRRAPDLDAPSPEMGFVFDALRTESGGRGMGVILDRLNVSPRTLRRRCHEAFGYGPKTLDRILRFQRFMILARQTKSPRLAALAIEAGYADQAHLTREVRELSGLSPATILKQVGT